MADTFNRGLLKLTSTSATTLYTVPSSTTTLVKSVYVGNIQAASTTVDLYIANGGTNYYIIKDGIIPPQTTLQIITEPIVMVTGDVLYIQAALANAVDAVTSYMERT